jgi:hypothetical protein
MDRWMARLKLLHLQVATERVVNRTTPGINTHMRLVALSPCRLVALVPCRLQHAALCRVLASRLSNSVPSINPFNLNPSLPNPERTLNCGIYPWGLTSSSALMQPQSRTVSDYVSLGESRSGELCTCSMFACRLTCGLLQKMTTACQSSFIFP